VTVRYDLSTVTQLLSAVPDRAVYIVYVSNTPLSGTADRMETACYHMYTAHVLIINQCFIQQQHFVVWHTATRFGTSSRVFYHVML
jgi:hypothetical protein